MDSAHKLGQEVRSDADLAHMAIQMAQAVL